MIGLCLACLVAVALQGSRPVRLAGYAGAALVAVICVHFALELNISSFCVWRYNADTRQILERLHALHDGKAAPFGLGVSWQLEPSFNFYRETKHWDWMTPARHSGPDGDYDYYVLIENDHGLIVRRGLRKIYQGDVSNTILAAPPGI